MQRTWMPTVAGILDIICGACGLIGGFVLIVLGTVGSGVLRYTGAEAPPFLPVAFFSAIAIPLLIIAILAIAGGIYALQRKRWGLALAGSIAAFFPSWLLGIAAIVFTVLSKNKFE